MTYLEARRIEHLFIRFRDTAMAYWSAFDLVEEQYGRLPNPRIDAPSDNIDRWMQLRQDINTMLPEVKHWADHIGGGVHGVSYPPPIVGGPAVRINYLDCVVEPRAGHHTVDRMKVINVIDRCIGAASFTKRRILARLVRPWCWLVDVPALIVSWPFAVMQKAGVPTKIVEGSWAQAVKVIGIGALWIGVLVYIARLQGFDAAMTALLQKLGIPPPTP
jgi:hypothetical protein